MPSLGEVFGEMLGLGSPSRQRRRQEQELALSAAPSDPSGPLNEEVRSAYLRKARDWASQHRPRGLNLLSRGRQLGSTLGLGVGLYFQLLQWLALAFLALTAAAVPFVVLSNTSVYTDAAHKGDYASGISAQPHLSLLSLTFASIFDTATDNGTLTHLAIRAGGSGGRTSSMGKGAFLTIIALADAAGVLALLALTAAMWRWSRRYAAAVGRVKVEPADYTVMVLGLPGEADDVHAIGEHFSRRFGAVVDVVMARDVGPVLGFCAQASKLEDKRRLLADQLAAEGGEAPEARMGAATTAAAAVAAEENMEKLAGAEQRLLKALLQIDKNLQQRTFPLKAALVTFNTTDAARACLEACPSGRFSSWFMPRQDRLKGRFAFWVQHPRPPGEYIYEHLQYGKASILVRAIIVRLVIFAMLLATLALLAKLQDVGNGYRNRLAWHKTDLTRDVVGAKPLGGEPDDMAFCTEQLPGFCSTAASAAYSATVRMDWGQHIGVASGSAAAASSYAAQAVLRAKVEDGLAACAAAGREACSHSHCLACHCLGLSRFSTTSATTSAWLADTKQICRAYLNPFAANVLSVRAAIAATIAVVNVLLKLVIRALVRFEKHWARSSEERAYAVHAYLAQVLNTAGVLLLVNAKPLQELAFIRNSWLRSYLFNGQYPDFTPGWYEDVGFAIVLLMCVDALLPALFIAASAAWKGLERCMLLRCSRGATQIEYNMAFLGLEFTLEDRVADIMLNVTLALMFGSGLPLLYPILAFSFLAQLLVERYSVTRLCATPVRYSPELPHLVLHVLPYAAALHCALGLWMHTHFEVTSDTLARGLRRLNFFESAWERITQPNGVLLLVLFLAIVAWLALLRFTVARLARALVARSHFCQWLCACGCLPGCGRCRRKPSGANQAAAAAAYPTFERALAAGLLQGTLTYRLPSHPSYVQAFARGIYKPIWYRAMGLTCYSRLVPTADGRQFAVVPEVLMAERYRLDATLESLPGRLRAAAARLLDPQRSTVSPTASAATRETVSAVVTIDQEHVDVMLRYEAGSHMYSDNYTEEASYSARQSALEYYAPTESGASNTLSSGGLQRAADFSHVSVAVAGTGSHRRATAPGEGPHVVQPAAHSFIAATPAHKQPPARTGTPSTDHSDREDAGAKPSAPPLPAFASGAAAAAQLPPPPSPVARLFGSGQTGEQRSPRKPTSPKAAEISGRAPPYDTVVVQRDRNGPDYADDEAPSAPAYHPNSSVDDAAYGLHARYGPALAPPAWQTQQGMYRGGGSGTAGQDRQQDEEQHSGSPMQRSPSRQYGPSYDQSLRSAAEVAEDSARGGKRLVVPPLRLQLDLPEFPLAPSAVPETSSEQRPTASGSSPLESHSLVMSSTASLASLAESVNDIYPSFPSPASLRASPRHKRQ